jgi:hypothetical protein
MVGGSSSVDRTGVDLVQAFADVTVPLAPGTTLRLEAGASW